MIIKKIFFTWFLLVFLSVFLYSFRLDFWRRNKLSVDYNPRTYPKLASHNPSFDLSAQSFLILDAESGKVLASKNPHLRLHPASITKMVTAINSLETYPLEEVITVREEYPRGKIMNLEVGEKITVESLIYGLLVHSANDAAFVLAGQNEAQIDIFINRMNNFIRQLGLRNTYLVNYDGLEDENHYSTSFDLAHLARFALENKVFEQAIRIEEMEVTDINGEISHQLETTNELLRQIPEVQGIKTGWTPQSGECFIGLVEVKGRRLITVILNSEDRFGETLQLIDWMNEKMVIHAIEG